MNRVNVWARPGVLLVRKVTRYPKICVFCKLPIESEQLPSVLLNNGREAHVECYCGELEQENDTKDPRQD